MVLFAVALAAVLLLPLLPRGPGEGLASERPKVVQGRLGPRKTDRRSRRDFAIRKNADFT
jgi:hypothetical protein